MSAIDRITMGSEVWIRWLLGDAGVFVRVRVARVSLEVELAPRVIERITGGRPEVDPRAASEEGATKLSRILGQNAHLWWHVGC